MTVNVDLMYLEDIVESIGSGPEACSNPDCTRDHSEDMPTLHSLCHPGTKTRLRVDLSVGVLFITCGECDDPICAIKIAERAEHHPFVSGEPDATVH